MLAIIAMMPFCLGARKNSKIILVAIAAEIWFDEDSVRIIPGHEPFENAALRIYYEY